MTLAEWRSMLDPVLSAHLSLRAMFVILFTRYMRNSDQNNTSEEFLEVNYIENSPNLLDEKIYWCLDYQSYDCLSAL